MANMLDAKTIDELQELGKLTGSEKTIVTYKGTDTRKVSINTLLGYIAGVLTGTTPIPISNNPSGTGSLIFIPEGENIPINQRTPGYFYLEEVKQNSIRAQVNIPTSVTVSANLSLRRL